MAPRLLIVDDERDGREALAELARSWGWEARGAPDGQAAIAPTFRARVTRILVKPGEQVARGQVVAEGTPEELKAATGQASLEDAFVSAIGSEEGLVK